MHLEEFAEGTSFFHRLDPRIKFITLVPFVFTVAVTHSIASLLTALVISCFMVVAAHLDIRKLFIRLVVVNTPILLLWLVLPFTYHGGRVFSIGVFNATHEGLMYVLAITIKANAIIIATIALLGTSDIFSLAHALIRLRVPKKLIYLFFFFYRYITVIHNEYLRLTKAMKVRCFKPLTNMHTYRTFANLVGMLLVRSYERSQRIYNAMLCRGFRSTFPVTRHFRFKINDAVFAALMAIATIALVIM